jgi:hypothetical protein
VILGLKELSYRADANLDGLVNMGDVVRIENIVLGLD